MSTFSGLNTAMTGLNAARVGLETTGNNIINVNTPGYTRQRAELTAVGALASTGLNASRPGLGQGVSVAGISRLADAHLEARLNATSGAVGHADTRAAALMDIEATLREPGENGLSAILGKFWNAWEGVANQPGEAAPATVLISSANDVAARLKLMHGELSDQWSAQHSALETMTAEVNSTAARVAELNASITSTIAAGGNANELLDQRGTLVTRLAELAGATSGENEGVFEVKIGNHVLVSGKTPHELTIAGGTSLETSAAGGAPTVNFDVQGGRIAGALSLLGPANDTGTGGAIAQMASSLDAVAKNLAETVNAAHRQGITADDVPGGNFFDPASTTAAGLTVIVSSAAELATRSKDGGKLDGSNALAIAQLATEKGGADDQWSTVVVSSGLAAQAEAQQSVNAALAHNAAASQQQAATGVSLDEENVALLAYQHAYQGAARVMTAVDEMLDTLINRTGIVGR
ncbi:flagellar hook-associated protein FlgK [Arthrobacter sp.]|uniref:flagellar hook-associated protein FlgK n=1 Tax=Arthrobacter sp. TaxID=1667 RepID=UPI003A93E618